MSELKPAFAATKVDAMRWPRHTGATETPATAQPTALTPAFTATEVDAMRWPRHTR